MVKLRSVTPEAVVRQPGDLPRSPLAQVAFVGRSNVGKSSLLGTLLMRKKMLPVSQRPGKTRALHFVRVRLDSGGAGEREFFVVDLPGYGFAHVPPPVREAWRRLIESYLSGNDRLRLVVHLMDSRHPLKPQDRQLISWIRHQGHPLQPVLTKIDKLSKRQLQSTLESVATDPDMAGLPRAVTFSAKTRAGRAELWRRIGQALDAHPRPT